MSYFLDRLQFFKRDPQPFADGHGFSKSEGRDWENSYRARWQYDKIVRSTHGVNCTGSCSWKIYVKNGLVTWETQQTDYPRTRGPAQSRATRLPAWCQLFLVPVQRQPAQVPADPRHAAAHVAAGTQDHVAGRGLGQHRAGPGQVA